MAINLRLEFESMLKSNGWNIFLQRRTSDGKPTYSTTLEKHTVRNRFASSASATGLARERAEGVNVEVDNVFYFKWDVNPGEGDRIYEEFPNQRTSTTVWLIDYAQPFRGVNGEIVYWVVGATREFTSDMSTVRD